MVENSIGEDIILLKDFTEGNLKRDKLENYKGSYKMGCFYYKDIQRAIEHIISDYKRVLKENEELKEKIREQTLLISPYYVKENYIPIQKIKDKIEELNKEIKSCAEIDAIFKIKQQQILQELLGSEE